MTFATYITGTPASSHNPSTDQPDMLTNTNSIPSLIAIDHYGFNNNDGGRHLQVQLPVLGVIPNPTGGLKNGEGTIYTKTVNGSSNLFYTPDLSGNEYQLTTINNTNFATFGPHNPGWTFLPGGLYLQYGSLANVTNGTTVTFPIAYSTALISFTIGVQNNSTTSSTSWAKSISTSGFILNVNQSPMPIVFWMAIGF